VSLLCFHPPLLLLLMSLSCPKSHPYRACHNCLTMAYGNACCFSAPELIMHWHSPSALFDNYHSL
jgi:hypothetical protein